MSPEKTHNLINKLVSSANKKINKNNFKSSFYFLSAASSVCRRFPVCFTHDEIEAALNNWSLKFFNKNHSAHNRLKSEVIDTQSLGGDGKNITCVIMTSIRPTGGHSRFALNLINNMGCSPENQQAAASSTTYSMKDETGNQQSAIHLILTNQTIPLPEWLHNVDPECIHDLNKTTKDPIPKIVMLRKLVENNLIPHIYYLIDPDDILPILALQSMNLTSTFINHADESFWAGTKLALNYAEMRYEGLYISRYFRKIENEKSSMMPISIAWKQAQQASKTGEHTITSVAPVAKENHPLFTKMLKIPDSAFLCLSVNPDYKLTPYKQYDFYETLERILEIAPNIWVVAVGHGIPDKLKMLSLRFKERVIGLDTFHYDLTPLYSRANLLLDGFPIGSTSVILEYLPFKKPFVTLAIPQADILGSQDPRLSCPEFEVFNRISYLQKVQSIFEYYPEHKRLAEEYYERFQRFRNIEYKPVLKFDPDFVMREELILEIIRNTNGFSTFDYFKFVIKLKVSFPVKWKMIRWVMIND